MCKIIIATISPQTQNGHSRSFKVICFGVSEIILYINVGLNSKASEDIDIESTEEIAVFDHPVSLDASYPENPREYPQ